MGLTVAPKERAMVVMVVIEADPSWSLYPPGNSLSKPNVYLPIYLSMYLSIYLSSSYISVTFKVNFRYGSLCTKNELEVQFNEF